MRYMCFHTSKFHLCFLCSMNCIDFLFAILVLPQENHWDGYEIKNINTAFIELRGTGSVFKHNTKQLFDKTSYNSLIHLTMPADTLPRHNIPLT